MNTIADFIPPILVAQGVFWVLVLVALSGAVMAVVPAKIVHNVLGLAQSMFGVAGIYLYLGSQFVSMMQLLIYVGAICVTYIFAIMLSPPLQEEFPKRKTAKLLSALLVSGVTFVAMVLMILNLKWTPVNQGARDWSVATLGSILLSRYFLVFELISLLLAIAIIGAIMIAGLGSERE